jgi:hypothetical protein
LLGSETARAAIRKSTATYDDDFQISLRTELVKGATELGSDPLDYELADKPAEQETKKAPPLFERND